MNKPVNPLAVTSAATSDIVSERWKFWATRAELVAAQKSTPTMPAFFRLDLYREAHRYAMIAALTRRIPIWIIEGEFLDNPFIPEDERQARLDAVVLRRGRTQARRDRKFKSKEPQHASR